MTIREGKCKEGRLGLIILSSFLLCQLLLVFKIPVHSLSQYDPQSVGSRQQSACVSHFSLSQLLTLAFRSSDMHTVKQKEKFWCCRIPSAIRCYLAFIISSLSIDDSKIPPHTVWLQFTQHYRRPHIYGATYHLSSWRGDYCKGGETAHTREREIETREDDGGETRGPQSTTARLNCLLLFTADLASVGNK